MKLFRLTTRNNVTESFNGLGASKHGGRFNSKGTKVVYCSQTVSLAVLENLVHYDTDIAPPLYLFEVDVSDESMKYEKSVENFLDDLERTKKIGDDWASTNSSLILKVPSLIISFEYNYLINPEHKDFSKLKITDHGAFHLDQRLLCK